MKYIVVFLFLIVMMMGSTWSFAESGVYLQATKEDKTIKKFTVDDLNYAIFLGNMFAVKECLEANKNLVNQFDDRGFSPIFASVICKRDEIAQYLLDNGADPNVYDRDKRILKYHYPILFWAAGNQGGHPKIVKLLLDHGAEVNARQGNSKTALMYAVYENNIDVLKMLIAHGADLDLRDDEGPYTALEWAMDIDSQKVLNPKKDRSEIILILKKATAEEQDTIRKKADATPDTKVDPPQ